MNPEQQAKIFQPGKVLIPGSGDLVTHFKVTPRKDLQSFSKDFHFVFLNTMHMYLRIPINLFELYASEFNEKMTIMNIELPGPLLVEDVHIPEGFIPPEPGWSRYLQGVPHEQWEGFRNWLLASKWMGHTKEGDKVLYGCEEEYVQVRDPVKLQTMQIVGIKEFVNISFFLPSNSGSKLYLNVKNGPPFQCVYVARSGPGAGEAIALFKKIGAM